MLRLPAPSPLHGRLLAEQLDAAGLTTAVLLDGDTIELPSLNQTDRDTAQAVVDAHPATAQTSIAAAATQRTNETTIRDRAEQALAANRTFLALPSPTNAQVVAQVKALTRQNNGIIRLILNRFDGTG